MRWQTVRRARDTLAAEEGTIVKDWGGRLPIALVYPNSYFVGMSSLGLQTLYRLCNSRQDVVAERVFWTPHDTPSSLETQQPLHSFAVLAVSLSFELDLLHLIDMLQRAGVPALASERDDDAPLVLVGGPVATANPELLAPLADAAFVGEIEGTLDLLLSVLADTAQAPRRERRSALAACPGIFVGQEGPRPVQRQWLADLDAHPVHSQVLTWDTEFGGMYLVEISRGCPRGCRFCLAGQIYRPMRQRSVGVILDQAREGLRYRPTIGLVGAAVSDYTDLDNLMEGLRALGARIGVSSLRVDPLPLSLLRALADSGMQTLTLAPETGSETLRRAISKGVRQEHILHAAERAQEFRFGQLKLYFMIGLPGETDQDVDAIATLTKEVKKRYSRRITVHATPFVPKPHTAFEREPMADAATVEGRLRRLTRALRAEGIGVRSEGMAWSRVQGVLARGDRALGSALAHLPSPTLAGWRRMCQQGGIVEEEYLRARTPDEALPWDIVACASQRHATERMG
ncbi:MAG: radical SAM protein [Anaerolineae bacterium]